MNMDLVNHLSNVKIENEQVFDCFKNGESVPEPPIWNQEFPIPPSIDTHQGIHSNYLNLYEPPCYDNPLFDLSKEIMDSAILYDHTQQHDHKLLNFTDDFNIMNPEFLSLEEYFPSGCLEDLSVQPLNVALPNDESRNSITKVSANSSANPNFSHNQNYPADVIKMESREIVESGFSYFTKDEGHTEMITYKCSTSCRSSLPTIGFDEISKHFDVPITKAAKRMNVGLTALKKRCRELNINRWPHRKIQSLKSLIDNLKEMGYTDHRDIEMLEEDIRRMEKSPDVELNHRAKKLRQACFKANFKKRRASSSSSLTKEHHHPWGLYA